MGCKIEFRFPVGTGIFIFASTSRPGPKSTQPHKKWIPGALSPYVERSECEADNSSLSSAENKNGWSVPRLFFGGGGGLKMTMHFRLVPGYAELYLHSSVRLHGMVLKHKEKIISYKYADGRYNLL
jgi:hypothetical protein